MDWLERLNRGPARISLGQGTVELLQWAYAKHLPDNWPHRHTYFEVCQVGEYGSGRFLVQGQAHPLASGDLFIARPGVVHQIVNASVPNMELFWVCFQWMPPADSEPGEVDRLLRAFAESPVVVASDENARLATLWQALRASVEGRIRLGYEPQAAGLMAALLLAIAQSAAGPYAPQPVEPGGPDAGDVAARLAVRYVHDNLNRPLLLSEIAGHVHTSSRHLTRLFERFTGTSPAVYVTRARLDRADGLLRRTDLPIKEVAAEVGYPDVHHFTRVFTRHFGCPPGEYRRRGGTGRVPNIQKPGALV